ncbi:peptidase S8/S53 domain-containing protein [Phycomyces blakesleeanus]
MTDQDIPSQIPLVPTYTSNTHSVKPHSVEQFSTIPNAYIVVFKPETDQETALIHYNEIEEIQQGLQRIFWKILFKCNTDYSNVDYIEQDKYVQAASIQKQAPWGLARISHREELNNLTFDEYIYEKDGGKHVKIYILDTGIYDKHNDFEGRASFGVNLLNNSSSEGDNGHGTHSAEIIGGNIYGVAKKAKLVSVKTLDEDGTRTVSDAIAGIHWVLKRHTFDVQKSLLNKWRYKEAIIALNCVTTISFVFNQAVDEGTHYGISIVVPAGNSGNNACYYSPPSAVGAIKIGASTYYDTAAQFSNYGDCVDLYAPGQNILSAWNSDKSAKYVLSEHRQQQHML